MGKPSAKKNFATFASYRKKRQATQDRANGRHGAVVDHSLGILDGKRNNQDVVHFGKRQEGGIEQGDQEERPAAERSS